MCRAATRWTGSASSGISTPRLGQLLPKSYRARSGRQRRRRRAPRRARRAPRAGRRTGSQSRSPVGGVERREDLAAAGVEDGERGSPLAAPLADARARARRACRRRAAGRPRLGAEPRAVAIPIRRPVNEPGPSPTAISVDRLPAAGGVGRALDLGQQRRSRAAGLPCSERPEQRLVQDLAVAPGADGGVGGRGVEADDDQRRPATPLTAEGEGADLLAFDEPGDLCACRGCSR